ncbi:DNA/RNA non-specific endonuclease [Kordiimonas lipolytica]|uniref:DNA/RNA non-specific endonuclease n=1 Tax=Kordiimonas lipolytica TaxID=1662421 RepID=A0ABV8UFF4_9PROT|nr:DNA/RNA non-specific endonuclease [Kordiimonas lipolytica]
MGDYVSRLAFSALLVLTLTSTSASAASRNCTAAEKQAANNQLKAIEADATVQSQIATRHAPFGVPVTTISANNEKVLFQNGYILGHDGDLRTALWVSYRLTANDIAGATGKDRVNCFRKDPRLSRTNAASTSDYKEPIYDQGHMTNDADLKDDLTEQINTYMMSNMSPQHCRFNRGIWLSLEHLTRIWAEKYGDILVTSGAIFDRDGLPGRDDDTAAMYMKSNNGKERVAVPSDYFKTFLRQENGVWHAITFKLPHNNDDNGVNWADVKPKVQAAISSMLEVETASGLDLYPNIDMTTVRESRDGYDWNLSIGRANFSSSCR